MEYLDTKLLSLTAEGGIYGKLRAKMPWLHNVPAKLAWGARRASPQGKQNIMSYATIIRIRCLLNTFVLYDSECRERSKLISLGAGNMDPQVISHVLGTKDRPTSLARC